MAVKLIGEAGLNEVWDHVAEAAQRYCLERVRHEIKIDVVVATATGEILGKCMEKN